MYRYHWPWDSWVNWGRFALLIWVKGTCKFISCLTENRLIATQILNLWVIFQFSDLSMGHFSVLRSKQISNDIFIE